MEAQSLISGFRPSSTIFPSSSSSSYSIVQPLKRVSFKSATHYPQSVQRSCSNKNKLDCIASVELENFFSGTDQVAKGEVWRKKLAETIHGDIDVLTTFTLDLLKQLGHDKHLSHWFDFSSSEPTQSAEKENSDADADSLENLSTNELVQLVNENREFLRLKSKEMEKMHDKLLLSYAEMENVMGRRAKRDAENSKKFAVQNFAKSLLEVADNLGRASSAVKESFSNIDILKDTSGAVPLLKTLLKGVEMTDKQLAKVFRKFGIEKYDPVNEQFDPHRHKAVFRVPDCSKEPGIIATVIKPGYMLYDRVIRPAEVGVTAEV